VAQQGRAIEKERKMKVRQEIGWTFDDVLLVPKRSSIRSRKDVSTAGQLTRTIRLKAPILSANMDTVTEAHMAIAMAQQGGIGIIHRFMSIERQADMVQRVKRAETMIVDRPASVPPQASVAEARQKMAELEVGGLVVATPDGILLGMVTTRDVLLAPNPDAPVAKVMTPRERLIVASTDETFTAARDKLFEHRIEKLPLLDADGRVTGLITAQDIRKIEEHPDATKDERGRLMVGVAVGVRADDMERAVACVEAGADILVVDIAHGHSDHTIAMVKKLKKRLGVPVIAGNVATPEGVCDLADAGADAVKVGVGAGSICITRIVTGFGVPQLTAIAECAEIGHRMHVPIVADGGLRTSGDIVKALAAGASTVMLGSMLAGTEESPGAPVVRDGRRYKVVRGMASLSANMQRKALEKEEVADEEWTEVVPEGVEAVVPYRGTVVDILNQMVGGLRSGLSYAGAHTIEELWEAAEFVPITQAGIKESGSHDVSKI
jgi:IMP dehydrogenase